MQNLLRLNQQRNVQCRKKRSVLQINLDKKRLSHDLLHRIVYEKKIDIVAGQEPGQGLPTSALVDNRGDCFLWFPGNQKLSRILTGEGIVGAELDGILYLSCYFSPNRDIHSFEAYLSDVETIVKSAGAQIIICGDLNAKSALCGSTVTDGRGDLLEEVILSNKLFCLNDGKVTFRNYNGASLIDLTLVSEKLESSIENWKVLDSLDSGSEHMYIIFTVNNEPKLSIPPPQKRTGWIFTETGKNKVNLYLEKNCDLKIPLEACSLVESIASCCDRSLKKRSKHQKLRPVYWWTQEIADKRGECHQKRRKLTRAANKQLSEQDSAHLKAQLKQSRKELRILISREKERCWKALCEDLDQDVWGRAYQIVAKKIGRKNGSPLTDNQVLEQVQNLFPTVHKQTWNYATLKETKDGQTVKKTEVDKIISELKNKKAPGPDCITADILKAVKKKYLPAITTVMQKHLRNSTFPEIWKITRLALIEKPAKNPTDSKTYRPICIMDTLGKVLEKIVTSRLQDELQANEGIHASQFGFRKGFSTLDALENIESVVERITKLAFKNQHCCVMVTLDIKNAFNSAPWNQIIKSLEAARISDYLINIVKHYLNKRKILLPNGEFFEMTCGVPQGSVLGPTLWNVFYNQVLTCVEEEHIRLVAYADDLAIVITGRNPTIAEENIRYAMTSVSNKLEKMELTLAKQKTEAIILRGWQRCKEMRITLADTVIPLSRSIKYMGIHVSNNWKFHEHIKQMKIKSQKIIRYLGRLTSNVNGPRAGKKRVLISAVHSAILYGAPIWACALKYKAHEATLESINRKLALMVSGAYRTAPTEALLTMSKIPPIRLLIEERLETHKGIKEKTEIKSTLLNKWENDWQQYDGHAKIFIPNLRAWIENQWADVNHYMAQIITGHGVFASYICRIGKRATPWCWYCGHAVVDNPEHTLFWCKNWQREREELNNKIGINLDRNNIGDQMLKSEENWKAINSFITDVMKQKMKDEKSAEQ